MHPLEGVLGRVFPDGGGAGGTGGDSRKDTVDVVGSAPGIIRQKCVCRALSDETNHF